MVNNSQYQHNKESLNSEWSTIPQISTKQRKFKQWMVNNSTISTKLCFVDKESLNSDGQQLQYQQNFESWNSGMVNNSQYQQNKESLNSGMVNNSQISTKQRKFKQWNGQQFHKYQQNKESLNSGGQQLTNMFKQRKFKQYWWNCWPSTV